MQTASAQLIAALARDCARRFPLPWFHYVRLLAVRDQLSRAFCEREALRGGSTIRRLDRQIQSQFHERTALSRDKAAAILSESDGLHTGGSLTAEEEIKDPYVLEFLGPTQRLATDAIFRAYGGQERCRRKQHTAPKSYLDSVVR